MEYKTMDKYGNFFTVTSSGDKLIINDDGIVRIHRTSCHTNSLASDDYQYITWDRAVDIINNFYMTKYYAILFGSSKVVEVYGDPYHICAKSFIHLSKDLDRAEAAARRQPTGKPAEAEEEVRLQKLDKILQNKTNR